jgi:hypothetical protein
VEPAFDNLYDDRNLFLFRPLWGFGTVFTISFKGRTPFAGDGAPLVLGKKILTPS